MDIEQSILTRLKVMTHLPWMSRMIMPTINQLILENKKFDPGHNIEAMIKCSMTSRPIFIDKYQGFNKKLMKTYTHFLQLFIMVEMNKKLTFFWYQMKKHHNKGHALILRVILNIGFND